MVVMLESPRNRMGFILAVLVIAGLAAGLGLGLLLGWVILPVKYVDTQICDLEAEHKDEYALLVAAAYSRDGNLDKARGRLAELEVPNTNQWVSDLIGRSAAAGKDVSEVQALAVLAEDLGVSNALLVAYLPSPTPRPTDTPVPTATPPPTDTPTATPEVPTETPVPPTDTPVPEPAETETPVPAPTATPAPPTSTPKPAPTNTKAPPQPTNTPAPTKAPLPKWSWSARLVGPYDGEGQECDGGGNLQIRVMVVNASGVQLRDVWIYDKYSKDYQVTGNVDSPDWGPGETKFEYGGAGGGGGSLCIAQGQGGACITDFTRDMPCYFLPPVEDLYAAGYCSCCEPNISLDRCRQLINEGKCFQTGAGHFSWRVVYKRNF
jgi:hypothetical protein